MGKGRVRWAASRRAGAVATALAIAGMAAGWSARKGPTGPERGIGRPAADFTLPDVDGRPVSLRDFAGKDAVVLAITGTECPLGNLYFPRLVELERSYRGRGVAFVAINPNAHESPAEVAEHARGHGVEFPVLKDGRNVVADRLGVERTCEVLVLDRRGVLRYRGAIDDQYERGRRRAEPSRRYLVEAIEAVLAGRSVAESSTEVIGCPIARADPESSSSRPRVRPASPEMLDAFKEVEAPVAVGRVTYTEDVAPILEAKCRSCHRPGQVGPFALTTYAQARKWAGAIREVVEERRMPPWHADPRYGHFANDRRLSAREYATLLAWADAGAPRGELAEEPAEAVEPREWAIGTPDVVLAMPEAFDVPAQGVIAYKRFRVPTGFSGDRWVRAAEARPGDRAVVHHIGVFILDPKTRAIRDVLAIYAPGDPASDYPPGVARLIPAGAELLIEVHYTPIGTARSDRSRVGLLFAEGAPRYRVRTQSVANQALLIPPGEANFRHESTFTFPNDARLLSVMPHMHLRGKSFRCSVAYPDGRRDVVLSVPAYDFGWQGLYRLAGPLALPRGSRIDCVAHFDNSAENPANPDPNKVVGWGEQSWDEMMVAYVDYCEDVPARVGAEDVARAANPRPPRPE